MQLLVTGSREGREDVWYWLDRWVARYGQPSRLILGDARGVDMQARVWGMRTLGRERVHVEYVPDWRDETGALDPQAGPRRNQRMVDLAHARDWCLAFPTPKSRGTWDCVERADAAGLYVAICPLYWPGSGANPRMYRDWIPNDQA